MRLLFFARTKASRTQFRSKKREGDTRTMTTMGTTTDYGDDLTTDTKIGKYNDILPRLIPEVPIDSSFPNYNEPTN